MIFTIPAKGGAPSGYIWPMRTTVFRRMSIIRIVFLLFAISYRFYIDCEFRNNAVDCTKLIISAGLVYCDSVPLKRFVDILSFLRSIFNIPYYHYVSEIASLSSIFDIHYSIFIVCFFIFTFHCSVRARLIF